MIVLHFQISRHLRQSSVDSRPVETWGTQKSKERKLVITDRTNRHFYQAVEMVVCPCLVLYRITWVFEYLM